MRISEHKTLARVMTPDGTVVDLGDVSSVLNLDESASPYGDASVTCAMIEDTATLALTDPRTQPGLRLLLEMRDTVGDPVRPFEITADHTGSVAAITAAHGPDLTPAKLTAVYFTPWNESGRAGTVVRANLLVTGRDVDHNSQELSFTAQTDEAAARGYRLLERLSITSPSTSLRTTVNFALARIGAALQSGVEDATITEADALVWEPGVSAWDYMRSLAEAYGYVVRCDERRRWTLTSRDATRTDGVSLSGAVLTDARERVALDDDLWADAVVVKYQWPNSSGVTQVRYDTSSLRANPVKVVLVERSVPYPGAGAARYWLRRLRARGRVFDLGEVADYSIRPGMKFTGFLPYTIAQVGYVETVTWTDEKVTIRTRGSSDTVANAIDLWPDGFYINQAVGVINDQAIGG